MIFSRLEAVVDHTADAAGRNVGQDLAGRVDLLVFPPVGYGQRDAERIADAAADELFEGNSRLDHAVRRQARFGHTQVQGHVGPAVCETPVHFDHALRVRVLQRNAVASESERIEQIAMFPGAFEHRGDRIVPVVLLSLDRIHTPAIDAHPEGTAVLLGHTGQVPDLVLPRLVLLVVVQVPRVVPDLVDVGRNQLRQPVALLKIHRQVGRGLTANLGQGRRVFLAVDGDPHHIGPGFGQLVDERHRGIHILRRRGRHALHGNRMAGADLDRTNSHAPGWISRHFQGDTPRLNGTGKGCIRVIGPAPARPILASRPDFGNRRAAGAAPKRVLALGEDRCSKNSKAR